MTVPYSVNNDDVVLPADINQYKKILEGETGYTDTFNLVSTTGTDFTIKLSDAAGARKLIIQDSAGVTVASIDSDGAITGSIDVGTTSLILPKSATPTQTAEGSVGWDTDDDVLTVGTGTATKRLGLTRGAGSNATANNELVYDTTAAALKVWDGSASQITGADTNFTNTRLAFRANRRKLAEWAATSTTSSSIGFGYTSGISATATNITGEPVAQITGSGTFLILNASGGTAVLSPSHSPRMLFRTQLPAASANVTSFQKGFFDTYSATATGAYIRIVTTGNTFFVTRQGASETATDLGVLSRTTVLGFEIESTDAGVTWVCRNQAGTVLATHTTNVPTAATGINFGYAAQIATAGVTHSLVYMLVEGTFA